MAIKPKYKQKWLMIPLLSVILLGAIALGINLFLQHPSFQRYLLTRITAGTGYDIQADHLGVRYTEGVELWAIQLKVSAHGTESRIAADRAKLTFDLMALLKGRLVPRRLEMDAVRVEIAKVPSQETGSPSSNTNQKPIGRPLPMEALLSKIPADIRLTNSALKIEGIDYQLDQANITVTTRPDDPASRDVTVSGQITSPLKNADLGINGWVTLPSQAGADKIGALKITVDQLPLGHLPKSNHLVFNEGLATLTADLTIDQSGAGISNGRVILTNPAFTVQKKSHLKKYALAQAELSFDARFTTTSVSLNPVTIKTPDATLLCAYGFDRKDMKAPRMELVVSSDPMPLATLKSIFPTPVIPGWIESEIFPIFTGGMARLEEFSLKGPLDAIQHLGMKENAGSLYLGVEIIDGTAFQDRPGPVVNDVSGLIRIKDGALLISGVSGQTGMSDLTNSGYTIPDLYEYPARHLINLSGDFDLTDLKAWHEQPILPKPLRDQLAFFTAFSGRLNGDVTLYLTGTKATGLTGEISLAKSIIARPDTLLPIKIDHGRIQMPTDSASSITAHGHWGESAIDLIGSLDLPHFLFKLPRRHNDHAELTAKWDLAELTKLIKKNKWGPKWLAQLKKATGSVESKLTLNQTVKQKGWQYGGGSFEWQEIDLDHVQLKRPITAKIGRLTLSADGAGQYAVNGLWGKSAFDLSGRYQDFFRHWSTKGKTQLSATDLAAVWVDTKLPVISAENRVPIELSIDQTDGKWSVLADLAMDGQKITIGDFTIAPSAKGNRVQSQLVYQKGRPVEIKKLQWQHQQQHLTIQGTLAPAGAHSTWLTLSAKNFPLSEMGLSYKKRPNRLAGQLTSTIDAAITGNRLETLAISGPLRINDAHLPLFDTPLLASNWDVDVLFNGTRTTVHSSVFPLATGERLQISGDLEGWKEIAGKLTVTLDKFYLDRWTQQFKRSKAPNISDLRPVASKPTPWAISPHLDISLFTPTVLWHDHPIGQLNAALRWSGYDGYIDAADLEAPDVTVNMSGRYGWPLSDQAGLSLLTYIHLEDIDSDRLLSGIGVKKNDIHGTLNLEGGLEIEGKSAREMAQTASGRFKLALKDGFIRHPNVLIKVLEFISLESIFIKKPPDTLKDQFYYKSIDAELVMEAGILSTENFFMKSPVFNMGATGKLDMSTMSLNLILGAQPLNTLDAIVSRVPIAGHILTGKNKALLVYTFEVDGTLDQPKVHQKPFKNLDKAVVGYFQRIFFTPTRVISQVGDYLQKIVEKIKTARQ